MSSIQMSQALELTDLLLKMKIPLALFVVGFFIVAGVSVSAIASIVTVVFIVVATFVFTIVSIAFIIVVAFVIVATAFILVISAVARASSRNTNRFDMENGNADKLPVNNDQHEIVSDISYEAFNLLRTSPIDLNKFVAHFLQQLIERACLNNFHHTTRSAASVSS
ncbi:hypothetical protein [Paenibacillus sp. UNC451MF]|uniref:hypothetical protein n=1 Tax=Paenibacillus sp. UNC451MF TaxID=1449063 RepID=UPI00048D0B2E|nr:hypothetical protein [Paenibacillus sp. UNC451MF]